MTRFLSVEDVIVLHDSETPVPLLDRNGLASAVGQPSQTFGGEFLYPTLLDQAAVLMRGISQAQAFFDGNKRTAWLSAVVFLRLNGVVISRASDEAALRLLRRLAKGDANVADLVVWLIEQT